MGGPLGHHAFEDHTGEVCLKLEAPTLALLFEEAALALAELMLAKPAGMETTEESISLTARDRESLLVAWLNELIFLSETRRLVYADATVRHVSDRELRATVRGIPPETLRTAVKAATLHGLAIVESKGGYAATIVLDV